MLNRRGGYWSTTKQTAMALYGLLEVMRARNESPQPFSVDVFVNGVPGSDAIVYRRVADVAGPDRRLTLPAREGANTVRLVKSGGGTLYWSARAILLRHARRGQSRAAAGNWRSPGSIRDWSPLV